MKRLLTASALTFVAAAAFGGPIYVNGSDGQLGTITPGGTFSNIGYSAYPTGAPIAFGDIAVSSSGAIYGEDYLGNQDLYFVNSANAQATLIGHTGDGIWGMTFSSKGVLYGANSTGLYTINTATGADTLIGVNGVPLAGDIEFDSAGNLYETGADGALYGINAATGAATRITGPNAAIPTDIYGLAFYKGTLYGFSGDNHVYSLDTTLGTATLIAPYSGDPFTGSTFGASTAAVPEPMTLSILGLSSLALLKRRARK